MSPAEIRDALRVVLSHADGTIAGGLWLMDASELGRLSRLLRDAES